MKRFTFILLSAVFLSGCASLGGRQTTTIYPILDDDIYFAPAQTVIMIPAGAKMIDEKGKVVYTWEKEEIRKVTKQSYILSEFYVTEITQSKVKK